MPAPSTDLPQTASPEFHRVAYLDLAPQTMAAALAGIGQWLREEGSPGTLRACWHSVVGPLDRILLWHSFADASSFDAAGLALAGSRNPFGVADVLRGLSINGFRKVPFAGEIPERSDGPLFEVRDYVLKPDGLSTMMELWRPLLPARLALAPWITAMYGLTGEAPRMLHIYPWRDLGERMAIRDGAQAVGWPPTDAPRQILEQNAAIYRAAAFSPLGGQARLPA